MTIEFLMPNEFQVLKIIRIIGPSWNRFTGYLPYLREYKAHEYDSKKNDVIDTELLEAVKQYFPESVLYDSVDLMFKGQLADHIRRMEYGSKKEVEVQFTPKVDMDLVPRLKGREFTIFRQTFQVRLLFSDNPDRANQIMDFYLCSVPFDQLDALAKTIQPV